MKAPHLLRKVHYWTSLAIALPFLVISVTGFLLQIKKHAAWVQPPEIRGTGTEPAVSFDQVLAAASSVPEAGVRGWDDVRRIDVRPDRGMLKVWAESGWEIQVDATTGAVLQSSLRRSDLIEALHDGSWFGTWAKYGLFLPASVALLVLGLSGVYLFWLPYQRRLARGRVSRES